MRAMLGLIGMALFASELHAQHHPFNPAPLPDFSVSNPSHRLSHARLRIAAASEDAAPLSPLRFGGLVLCSTSACYRLPRLPGKQPAAGGNGSASLLADALLPFTQIDTLYFEDRRGVNVTGSVTLSRPLLIEQHYYGGEIFVLLKPLRTGTQVSYAPSFATSGFLREEGQSIYYNPRLPLDIALRHGVRFSLPAGALQQATIFNAQVADTGAPYPLIDIFPYINLQKPASLTIRPLGRTVAGNIPKVPAPSLPGGKDGHNLRPAKPPEQRRFDVLRTGTFTP